MKDYEQNRPDGPYQLVVRYGTQRLKRSTVQPMHGGPTKSLCGPIGVWKCLSVVNCHCLMMLTCWVDEKGLVSLIGLQERKSKKRPDPFCLRLICKYSETHDEEWRK